jgi:hypothetical protein
MFFDLLETLKRLEQRSGGSHFLVRDNLLDSLLAKIEDARPGYPPFK